MTPNISKYAILFKQMDEAIEHSMEQGLPLSSIELTPNEWDLFLDAFRTYSKPHSLLNNGSTLALDKAENSGIAWYKHIKVYREKI